MDAVFCGRDYLGTNRFESLYCLESEIVYFDRAEVPISSTEIRFDAMQQWEYVPPVAKSFYTKKVLIVGGESTGKSTLVQNLALAYNTNFVGEVGRATCDYAGGEQYMIADDLIENLLKQKIYADEEAKHSNRLLFVDTDALTTKFYIDFLLNPASDGSVKTHKLADAINALNKWDLVIFLELTVTFVQDGTRSEEIAADRKKYSDQIRQLFEKSNIPLEIIGGGYIDRFTRAKEIIKDRFHVETIW